MYSVSPRFLEAINQSGNRKTVADVYYGNAAEPIYTDLPVTDGNIKVSSKARSRRSGSLSLGDPTLIEALEPWGVEIVIRTGVTYVDGEELVPMGVFVLDSEETELTDPFPKLELFDRSQKVFEMPAYAIVGDGGFAGDTARAILVRAVEGAAQGYPNTPKWIVEFEDGLPNPKVPGGFDPGTDRWALAEKCAELLGCEVYFDRNGRPQVAVPPIMDESINSTDVDWAIAWGVNLIDAKRTTSRENTYNCVIVRGGPKNAAADPNRPYAQQADMDPASKTYWHGPFGKKTLVIENELIKTANQALRLAKAKLTQSLSLTKKLSVTCLANPALQEGDFVSVVYEDGTVDYAMVDGFTFDFKKIEFELDLRTVNSNIDRQAFEEGDV